MSLFTAKIQSIAPKEYKCPCHVAVCVLLHCWQMTWKFIVSNINSKLFPEYALKMGQCIITVGLWNIWGNSYKKYRKIYTTCSCRCIRSQYFWKFLPAAMLHNKKMDQSHTTGKITIKPFPYVTQNMFQSNTTMALKWWL